MFIVIGYNATHLSAPFRLFLSFTLQVLILKASLMHTDAAESAHGQYIATLALYTTHLFPSHLYATIP